MSAGESKQLNFLLKIKEKKRKNDIFWSGTASRLARSDSNFIHMPWVCVLPIASVLTTLGHVPEKSEGDGGEMRAGKSKTEKFSP
jgi:hypothetical protein